MKKEAKYLTLELIWQARQLFADATCSICGVTVVWDSDTKRDDSGRVSNNGIFNLEKENWSTICLGCLKIQTLKETIERRNIK